MPRRSVSAADALLASRLAAQAFSSGDVGQFDGLMTAGTRANLADNTGAAETAFRAALALQQKLLGRDNPNTATTMMSLALQLSNEGRFAEADTMFDQAAKLTPRSAEVIAPARLLHYRGLDAMNQGKLELALQLLTQADALYAAQVPESALNAKPPPTVATHYSFNRAQVTSSLAPDESLLTDPRAQSALLGLIEVRRNRAVVLRVLGRPADADKLLQSASDLARGNGLARPLVNARLYRTTALTSFAQGQDSVALEELHEVHDGIRPGSAGIEAAGGDLPAERARVAAYRSRRRRAAAVPRRGNRAGRAEVGHHAGPDGPVPRRLRGGGGGAEGQGPVTAGGDVHRGAACAGRHHQPADRPGQRDAGGEFAQPEGRRGHPAAARPEGQAGYLAEPA